MSIKEKLRKVKAQERSLSLALLVLLVALAAYGLGRLSLLEVEREPIRIEEVEVWSKE